MTDLPYEPSPADLDERQLYVRHLGYLRQARDALARAEQLRVHARLVGVDIPAVDPQLDALLSEVLATASALVPEPEPHDPVTVTVHLRGALPVAWTVLRELTKADAAVVLGLIDDGRLDGGPLFVGPGLVVLGGFLRRGVPVFRNNLGHILPYPGAKALYLDVAGHYQLVQHRSP